MAAYSGALTRAAHTAFRPPVPGINPEHEHPEPDPDIFAPTPEGVQEQGPTGDVWQPADDPTYSDMRDADIHHWTALQDPVPSGVPSGPAGIAATVRMLANHARELFRPDTYVPYKHATQGHHIQYVEGRRPQNAGSSVPDDMGYLVVGRTGRNSYDLTNQPNEVYSQEPGGGGRYRLGTNIENWGLYEFPTQQGQDAWLRGYTGLVPQFPVDKPRVEDSAPYTPNSSGTTTWVMPTFQVPSMFSLPSETAITDYTTATEEEEPPAQFDDGGRM